eukprot:scaffold91602_cov48-Phaeocystis_antarctica.AAC.2
MLSKCGHSTLSGAVVGRAARAVRRRVDTATTGWVHAATTPYTKGFLYTHRGPPARRPGCRQGRSC